MVRAADSATRGSTPCADDYSLFRMAIAMFFDVHCFPHFHRSVTLMAQPRSVSTTSP